ncbi:LysR family transcriptional regulator [Sphingomonas sp. JC676]|uniref:LysR family transcriptional regulator n=1 Tax=Sphingomonas sp. JC676 TaxID=2768065 RepID=UPI001657754C|nr:LysR family transcriptional regulator [Sphingomonas sp. JC676]MBC9031926.1 LysR family transcriptional regulator [Sphingomonas sp. JC676]
MLEGADLRRAAVFHAVARAGGITAAARAIGKSPPAVHNDLRRFERDVGVVLMERSGRALRLTPRGRVLFETIGRALDEIERVRAHLSRADVSQSPLRIGAVTGFARYRLAPRLLDALDAARPLIFVTGAHADLLAALSAGRIDLAVTYRAVTAVPIDSVAVASEALVLVGEGTRDVSDLESIERLRFITYDEHDYVFGRWFADVHGRQPAALIQHDHCIELEEALAGVRAGRGATIAPLDACLAFGLVPAPGQCANTIYLCGVGSALASPEAALIRACLDQASGTP